MSKATPELVRLARRTQLSLIRLCQSVEQARDAGHEVPSWLLKLCRRLVHEHGRFRNAIDGERTLFVIHRKLKRQHYRQRSRQVSGGARQRIRGRLLAAWDGRCAYCSRPTNEPTLDHVIPVSKGGAHSDDNAVLACPSCNHCKDDRTPQEWAHDILGQRRRRWFSLRRGVSR